MRDRDENRLTSSSCCNQGGLVVQCDWVEVGVVQEHRPIRPVRDCQNRTGLGRFRGLGLCLLQLQCVTPPIHAMQAILSQACQQLQRGQMDGAHAHTL